ncbi:hypothetical protein EZV62_026826 [Acer yangbiense]|uniref:Uncharacterized protein n=1 Tax=Acer yangbiense TaxID=1000413 RepID=A0A5C7GT82_9ROSI|nr:hypothetical protein EZV62_026826 [Acer yangbiense]
MKETVDGDSGCPDDYDMDEEEVDELDNNRDYDVDKSFVFTQGWDSEMVVDYRIDEDEFHKISLMECDFFIRKPPDRDNDVISGSLVGYILLVQYMPSSSYEQL